MTHATDDSKKPPPENGLHRSDVAGSVAWLLVGSTAVAAVISPGGDPYSLVFYTAVIFPASIGAWWLGFRLGRSSQRESCVDDSRSKDKFTP